MKKCLALPLLILSVSGLFAQKISIDNVRKAALRTSDAIRQGADVKGYYFFYISDKIDKKTNQYTLRILDNNLNQLKDIKFEDSKHVTVLESSFNGTDLIFLFYNEDELTFEYQVYGADGKRKPFNYTRQLSKKEKRYLEMTYLATNDEENTFKGLYPIDGKGFISNMPSREEKDYTFQVDYFSTEKRKQWTYIPTEDAKRTAGDYLGTHNGVVYFEVLKFKSMMDQKPDSYLLGLDLETGRKLFEKPTDGKFRFYPSSLSVISGKAYLYGEYFDVGANIMKDKSQGFAFWGVDEKGVVTSEKYNSWELQLGKFVNVTAKGKIDDFGYMFLHAIVQTPDGSVYAVGEGYKKAASALGITAKILAGGRGTGISTVKVKVTDMIMVQFDKDFNVKGVKVYPKNSNNVELEGGMEFVSVALLGKMIKYNYGGFDYRYLQTNADLSSFSVCYSDYERSKEYKGGVFKSITYNEGKITEDRINTKSDATVTWVLPGKQGQVLLIDYYKKDKRLDAHFEKLN